MTRGRKPDRHGHPPKGVSVTVSQDDEGDDITSCVVIEAEADGQKQTNKPRGQAKRALELLELVRIPEPELRLTSYPHQLSGGQRQRVMIAMALANEPDLLIADEPTTSVDVTVQAQLLTLLNDLRSRLGMAMLLITHDLRIVRKMAKRVYVMYGGEVVESGKVNGGGRYFNSCLTRQPSIRRAVRLHSAAVS